MYHSGSVATWHRVPFAEIRRQGQARFARAGAPLTPVSASGDQVVGQVARARPGPRLVHSVARDWYTAKPPSKVQVAFLLWTLACQTTRSFASPAEKEVPYVRQTTGEFAKKPCRRESRERSERDGSKCDEIRNTLRRIQVIPLDDQIGDVSDPAYRRLRSAGEGILPCLIGIMSDSSRANDPRQAPKYDGVVLGDVAFFVLLDIVHAPDKDLVSALPEQIRSRWEADGIWAYFDFVRLPRGRALVQSAIAAWLEGRGLIGHAGAGAVPWKGQSPPEEPCQTPDAFGR